MEGFFQSAAKKGGMLKDLKQQYKDGILTEAQYNGASSAASDGMMSDILGGAGSLLSGVSSIASNVINSSNIADTSMYQSQIDNLYGIGAANYQNADQLASDYNNLGTLAIPTMEEVRGMNTGQKIGSIASSTATGAMAGLTVGGPWGALAGAVVGLGAGVGGVLSGDAKARVESERLNMDSKYATLNATRNLEASGERLADRNFRNRLGNVAATGGKIERKQMSLDEFARRALSKPQQKKPQANSRIIRTKGNGGVCIRIKR